MKLKFIDGGRLIRYTRPPRSPQGVEDSFNTLSGDELEQFRKVCVNLVDPQKYIAERLNEYGWTEEMLARADYFVPVKLPTPFLISKDRGAALRIVSTTRNKLVFCMLRALR